MTPLLFQPGMLFAQAVGQISYLLAQEVETIARLPDSANSIPHCGIVGTG